MKNKRNLGIRAALASAMFLGFAPVFGKQAILFGFTPLAVVAYRTGIAAVLILLLMFIYKRNFFYIYPVGLIGCVLAGFINGLGSILYYSALGRLDASIGQLIYSFYPLFVAIWLFIDRQPISRVTVFRLALAIPGIILLISTGKTAVDLLGAGFMLGSSILYALHLIINQRVLYEVPAPTVTLYTLLSMSATVIITYLLFDNTLPIQPAPWWPIMGLALFTFFARFTLFMGVKHLGGMQTSILGLSELLITVILGNIWLGDQLTVLQWIGAVLLALSLALVGFDKYTPEKRHTAGWLSWINSPKINPADLNWHSRP